MFDEKDLLAILECIRRGNYAGQEIDGVIGLRNKVAQAIKDLKEEKKGLALVE